MYYFKPLPVILGCAFMLQEVSAAKMTLHHQHCLPMAECKPTSILKKPGIYSNMH